MRDCRCSLPAAAVYLQTFLFFFCFLFIICMQIQNMTTAENVHILFLSGDNIVMFVFIKQYAGAFKNVYFSVKK